MSASTPAFLGVCDFRVHRAEVSLSAETFALLKRNRTVIVRHADFVQEGVDFQMARPLSGEAVAALKALKITVDPSKARLQLNEVGESALVLSFDYKRTNGVVFTERGPGMYLATGERTSWRCAQDSDLCFYFEDNGALKAQALKC